VFAHGSISRKLFAVLLSPAESFKLGCQMQYYLKLTTDACGTLYIQGFTANEYWSIRIKVGQQPKQEGEKQMGTKWRGRIVR
jgi:hypothetical protein